MLSFEANVLDRWEVLIFTEKLIINCVKISQCRGEKHPLSLKLYDPLKALSDNGFDGWHI